MFALLHVGKYCSKLNLLVSGDDISLYNFAFALLTTRLAFGFALFSMELSLMYSHTLH